MSLFKKLFGKQETMYNKIKVYDRTADNKNLSRVGEKK